MLTARRQQFVLGIMEGKTPTDCYLDLYKVKSRAVAWSASNRLMSNVEVKEYLNKLQKEAEERAVSATVATVLERKQVLSDIIRARIGNLVDVNGNVTLTPENLNSAGVSEIKITTGENKTGPWTSKTVKLRDVVSAVQALNDMEQIGKPNTVVNITDIKIRVEYESVKQLEQLVKPDIIQG